MKNKLRLIFLCITGLLWCSNSLLAQTNQTTQLKQDTSNSVNSPVVQKKFWRASGELMIAQIIPWSYNYYVRDADFARISFESIWHNMNPDNWKWDDNNFTTNQIAHPYHGNLYYNAFRTNGYSFGQSAIAAVAGSLMWEIAGETHPPAPNDLINTSFGGIMLGEMTYRVSNRIIDKKQRGTKRQVQEIFGLLINPMNGVNRLLDGKWGRVSTLPITDLDTISLGGDLDIGARQISRHIGDLLNKGKVGWYARLRLQYGNPFTPSKIPFNNFDMKLELGQDDSARVNVLSVNGLLSSWELKSNMRESQVISLTANYDFYHNAAFVYGSQSVNFSLYSKYIPNDNIAIDTRFGMGGVVLAAVPDAYLYYGEGRNYDYGPGMSLIGQADLILYNKFTTSLNYKGGAFVTINGNSSTHFLHVLSGELRYRIFRQLSAGSEFGYLLLHSNYRDYPNTNDKYSFIRVSLGYKI